MNANYITIGEAARRSGVAASALRFYESKKLIESIRGPGNQRQYHRATLRRISVIKIAQALGLSLGEISQALATLPNNRNPTKKDWESLSSVWKVQLDERIMGLQNLRDQLSGCIGCGCLSMKRCQLYNAGDRASVLGPGPRYLMGDSSSDA